MHKFKNCSHLSACIAKNIKERQKDHATLKNCAQLSYTIQHTAVVIMFSLNLHIITAQYHSSDAAYWRGMGHEDQNRNHK